VLERAKHKSSREVERLIAELAPREDVPSRIRALPGVRRAGAHADGMAVAVSSDAASVSSDAASPSSNAGSIASDAALADGDQAAGVPHQRPSADREVAGLARDALSRRTSVPGNVPKPIVPLGQRRYKIEITVDEATHDKLRSLQDLLGRSGTGRDPAAIISRAIDVLLVRTLARRAGCTDRPKPTKRQRTDWMRLSGGAAAAPQLQRGQRTRTIPAAVRREVWRRDCGRCCYVDALGRRCAATSNVELHHREPFAMGGMHTSQNIELRCAAHNQYQADLDFSRSFMDGRRGKAARTFVDGRRGRPAPTFPGECRGTATTP
jgi:hypothetical protein